MIDHGVIKHKDKYLFVTRDVVNVGDWTTSSGGYLTRSNVPAHANIMTHSIISGTSLVPIRKVIGHSGVQALANSGLVLFEIVNDDIENPDLVILER